MSGNIKKLCKYNGKYDDQQKYKAIFEAAMVSAPDGFTENSPIPPSQYVTLKNLVQENFSIRF